MPLTIPRDDRRASAAEGIATESSYSSLGICRHRHELGFLWFSTVGSLFRLD